MRNINENFLNFLIKISHKTSRQDFENIRELIEHREGGVALELLCAQLYEYEVIIDSVELAAIRDFSKTFNVDVSGYIQ